MVPPSGRNRAALSEELIDDAYRFEFFQAVRVLQSLAAEESADRGGRSRSPVGLDHAPKQEVVRFRALPSHTFPPGSISRIRPTEKGDAKDQAAGPLKMDVTFMGLTGPNGVLPRHYTSMLIERVRGKDFALRDFLDMFNHRAVSLFYRAWEKYRFVIAYERMMQSGPEDEEDLFTRCLYSLVGFGTGGLRRRMEFDDEALLFYAGHFAHFPRAAVSLEQIVADYFELPTQVIQFLGQWLYLSEDDQSSLPCPRWPQGLNMELGTSVVVGERVWDVEGTFRVRLGPVGYGQFRRFTPLGDALRPLCQMVRSYVGPQFEFNVQPVLKAAEVPWCSLGGDGTDPSCLGWNTWIRCGEFEQDVSDAVFFTMV